MKPSYGEEYRGRHRHPLNRLCHYIGIPMIVVSLAIIFVNFRWGVFLFTLGWIFQFAGHFIEGNQPAFFKNPIYLLIGPLWVIRRLRQLLSSSSTDRRSKL